MWGNSVRNIRNRKKFTKAFVNSPICFVISNWKSLVSAYFIVENITFSMKWGRIKDEFKSLRWCFHWMEQRARLSSSIKQQPLKVSIPVDVARFLKVFEAFRWSRSEKRILAHWDDDECIGCKSKARNCSKRRLSSSNRLFRHLWAELSTTDSNFTLRFLFGYLFLVSKFHSLKQLRLIARVKC